jgi:hypothetical protein
MNTLGGNSIVGRLETVGVSTRERAGSGDPTRTRAHTHAHTHTRTQHLANATLAVARPFRTDSCCGGVVEGTQVAVARALSQGFRV